MKLYLRKKWSDQFGFDEEKSRNVFIGREREISSLKHAIRNNTSSTILVSSVRGVGKTSFVHRAISDIRDEISPIFVNVGHTLRDKKKDNDSSTGRDFLVSLIRASFLTEKFKNDTEIENLYHQSIGQFKKETESLSNSVNENKLGFLAQFNQQLDGGSIRLMLAVSGITLGSLGIFSENIWLKIIGLISILFLSFSVGLKFEWGWNKILRKINNTRDSYQIDDSPEYLETKFEQWLEGISNSQKVVFVIDELDKEEAEEAFDSIKEYKNLFARSFAHFIFICNEKAYAFTQKSRLESKYPTLFTHVFYLPTPTSEEMSSYLNDVLSIKNTEKEIEELKKFLLFKAANDFFNLKNLLNDLSEFDSAGEQFIDSETIKSIDRRYLDATKVYDYINCFYTYYSHVPKFFWQANSNIQAEVFAFANNNLMKDFTIDLNKSEHIANLVLLLSRIGVLEGRDLLPGEQTTSNSLERYTWTGQYRDIKSLDQLFPEDNDFISAMEKLIRLANDIDDLKENYEDGSFSDYQVITQGRDGESLAGVNLYNTYKKHLDLYDNLKNPEERLYARADEAKKATKELVETITNVENKTFDIFLNALEVILKEKNGKIIRTSLDNSINPAFAIRSWETKFANHPNCLFYIQGSAKQLMIIKGIRDFSSNREVELAELRARKDVLVINFETGSHAIKKHPTTKANKAGRRRKTSVEVSNFINFVLPTDVRDLAKIIKIAVEHF